MYLTDIQTYFQGLAQSHADIQHGLNGRTAFFRLQGLGPLMQIPNNLGDQLLAVERFGGRAVGEFDANKLQQFITLRFGKLLDIPTDGDFESAIDECMGECLLVLMDFISKMREDFLADDCSWLKYVDFTGVSWSEFDGPWIERHYGWDLIIPFKASFPDYRADKWL